MQKFLARSDKLEFIRSQIDEQTPVRFSCSDFGDPAAWDHDDVSSRYHELQILQQLRDFVAGLFKQRLTKELFVTIQILGPNSIDFTDFHERADIVYIIKNFKHGAFRNTKAVIPTGILFYWLYGGDYSYFFTASNFINAIIDDINDLDTVIIVLNEVDEELDDLLLKWIHGRAAKNECWAYAKLVVSQRRFRKFKDYPYLFLRDHDIVDHSIVTCRPIWSRERHHMFHPEFIKDAKLLLMLISRPRSTSGTFELKRRDLIDDLMRCLLTVHFDAMDAKERLIRKEFYEIAADKRSSDIIDYCLDKHATTDIDLPANKMAEAEITLMAALRRKHGFYSQQLDQEYGYKIKFLRWVRFSNFGVRTADIKIINELLQMPNRPVIKSFLIVLHDTVIGILNQLRIPISILKAALTNFDIYKDHNELMKTLFSIYRQEFD